MKSMNLKAISERWGNYRKANNEKPLVRENELKKIFELINSQEGERILEVGTGNGYLTFPMAKQIGENGGIVTADVIQDNLDSVEKKNVEKLNISTLKLSDKDKRLLPEKYSNYFDKVALIATFHHFDNRNMNTGEEGRKNALAEFHRVLKSGGKLIMADPLDGTITSKYFNAVDSPIHCHPEGHPHDFPTKTTLKELVEMTGFKNINIKVESVPWKFLSEEEAKNFVHTIHNSKCIAEGSFNVAKNILGFKKKDGYYELGWELFFLTAEK